MSDHTLDHGVIFQVKIPKEEGLTYRTIISNLEDGGVLIRQRSEVMVTDGRGVPTAVATLREGVDLGESHEATSEGPEG